MTIMVFAAHPDDEVLGCGGVIARLTEQGEKVISVIFSYGEKFPPWVSGEKLVRKRVRESKKADEILGTYKTIFMGFSDLEVANSVNEKTVEKVSGLIIEFNPEKIFYHSKNDTHPDHIAVNRIVDMALEKSKNNPERYEFEVSNMINLFNRNDATIIWDISDTFRKKIRALRQFKSQSVLLDLLVPIVIFKMMLNGKKYGFKYAEKYYLIE
ncbi:MAG: PIG-L family deacetylase [Candidatus Nanoarchaeia archaeon]|nr:PIG-L family deacetylase [Candidatus Nanoarchaeia archaeon]